MIQRTLSIIKPDAMKNGNMGDIIALLQKNGFNIVAAKMLKMSKAQAEGFYAVHRERPFFGSLTDFMRQGPVMVMVLEADDAIARYRAVMGATNPAQAEDGTIRKLYATNVEQNAVHGSDAPETAAVEIAYFFTPLELIALQQA
ncbi:MAG: nucleoside-diphosphate kinase [Deltaproteobacteria bacterium]|nr:nucleoside-diphosphate kinase [Deltaproteobacteria bacterium]